MTRPPVLGAIGDDFTGAVELAGVLAAEGARVLFATSPDAVPAAVADIDAVVVALRTRVARPAEAEAATARAATALEGLGVRQLFLKYCATFDSTDAGNIGNCAELLARRRDARSVLFVPAFPEALRTVFQGHMFVGAQLLAESPKRLDPLTPMIQSDLVRVLAPQTRLAVGRLPWTVVAAGPEAIRAHAVAQAGAGTPFLIADTITDADLATIAAASWDWPVGTGGSTVAMHYPALWRAHGLAPDCAPRPAGTARGPGAVLAGSCADRTREQLAEFARAHPVLHLDPRAADPLAEARAWIARHLPAPIAITTSADPAAVAEAQAQLGPIEAGRRAERLMGQLARLLVDMGVRRLLVAGGETSGAVVQALGIERLDIAPYRALGVGRCLAERPVRLALCLKSGKLGAVDMFATTLAAMEDR